MHTGNLARSARLGVALVLVIAGLTVIGARSTEATEDPPNVVVFLADDLDATTTPFWFAMPRTAALIRNRGMSFTNAFSSTPSCCPARVSLLTGRYAHNTGVFSNVGDLGGHSAFRENGNEARVFPLRLQQAGYRTALIGKYLNGYAATEAGNEPPPGWSDWYGLSGESFLDGYSYELNENGTLVSYGNAPTDYLTDVLARKTLDFIDDTEANDGQPFFVLVTPSAPHLPLPPAPRHANHPWANANAPRRANFYETDISDKPSWLRLSASFRDRFRPYVDVDFRSRMGSLIALDELVGGVVSKLAATGELANTYIVFTSDNGYNLGAHHLVDKLVPYEESLRVPMVVAGPDVTTGTEQRMVLLTDLAPTMLDLAGLPPDEAHDGRSLVPLLTRSNPPTWRTDFLAEYITSTLPGTPPPRRLLAGIIFDVPSYTAVRTGRYLFVRWYTDDETNGTHEYELYDLATDPRQLQNLISTQQGITQHAVIVQTLHARLVTLESCSGVTCR
jgi:arylsulfatase A-like enzyme